MLSDEGIGLHVLRRLEARATEFPGVDFMDAGTSGMRVLHGIADRRKAVFIDCAFMREAPGVIRRFLPREAQPAELLPRLSLHENDLWSALQISRKLGECPPEVVVFGIQPQTVEPGTGLSPVLQARLEEYVGVVGRELAEGGIGAHA